VGDRALLAIAFNPFSQMRNTLLPFDPAPLHHLKHCSKGSLTEGEGSVQLTSFYLLV
jgi:hypothetical protein